MGIANKRPEDIRGLKFKSKELKLFQYGNDGQIALDGSANLIRNVVKLLNSDTAIGGIQLNYNRSELAPLGKSKMEEICTHSFSPGMTIITIPTNGNTEDLIRYKFEEKKGENQVYCSCQE